MKRTNLVLDERLLEAATRLMGAKTYSEAVNRALEESIRTAQARGLLDFVGKNVWSGDLATLREDARSTRRSRRAK